MTERVLLLGGYGAFGGRIARLLRWRPDLEVVIAGRSIERARAFCAAHGGTPLAVDRDTGLAASLAALRPHIVVDAAGPFHAYGDDPYRVARAALAAGAHYLDLADDPSFVTGIGALDAVAKAAGRAALSGASSLPAISGAAADRLVRGLADVATIETTILPGNRAPRGDSLVRAILAQAGRPLPMRRGGRPTTAFGWSEQRRRTITVAGASPLAGRWSALADAPDLRLFPARYGAGSVSFRAGLELPLLQFGLAALAWLPRLGIVRSLAPAADALRRMADCLRPLGSDRGGMVVAVTGRLASGAAERRTWSLIVEAGEGPFVPALPAALLVPKLLAGDVAPGARPCLDALDLAEIESGLAALPARTAIAEEPAPSLYEAALGDAWATLPPPLRELHDVRDQRRFIGEASVEAGGHPLAGLVRRAFGFPPAAARVPVSVDLERRGDRERWTRRFGGRRFGSTLVGAPEGDGGVVERFGPLAIRLRLVADDRGIAMPVEGARLFGLDLPGFLVPTSDTRESIDAEGRFSFDVDLGLPGIGRIVRYRGWLTPVRG